MTAIEPTAADTPDQPHPLLRGASPAVIRSWLLPEDRATFVDEYEQAMDDARSSLDLTPVHALVEQWRQVAVSQSNPAAFRDAVRRWAELSTGQPVPTDEPFEKTRARAGM